MPYTGYVNATRLTGLDPRQLRTDAGIKIVTVARALDISRTAVFNWERGTHRPSGEHGAAYVRFILGLARHVAVREG